VFFGFIADRVGIDRLLRWCILATAVAIAVFAFNPGAGLGEAALIVAGLGLAPIYPCTMTRTPQRLGARLSAHAIGMQVSAAMIGGAILPSASGWLGQSLGLEAIPAATLGMALMLLVLHEALVRQGGEPSRRDE
jgi:fucose permease